MRYYILVSILWPMPVTYKRTTVQPDPGEQSEGPALPVSLVAVAAVQPGSVCNATYIIDVPY